MDALFIQQNYEKDGCRKRNEGSLMFSGIIEILKAYQNYFLLFTFYFLLFTFYFYKTSIIF
ncbi:hypothetical protein CQ046_04315 [Chryseobacterium sp. MYb7]|nr:hypothetical protein CQ046_04315 [Chryseobacterium sp. MYb7]